MTTLKHVGRALELHVGRALEHQTLFLQKTSCITKCAFLLYPFKSKYREGFQTFFWYTCIFLGGILRIGIQCIVEKIIKCIQLKSN